MLAKNLVCATCWQDFFNTEAFEQVCTWDHVSGNRRQSPTIRTERPSNFIEVSDCNWCAYIRTFIGASCEAAEVVGISLGPAQLGTAIPQGNNVFYLSIDCKSPGGQWLRGWSLWLHAWTTEVDASATHVTARPLRTDVDGEDARKQLLTWLTECAGHDRCHNVHRESTLPTRVIEISPPGSQYPRLVESGGRRGTYATLSYCWGTAFTTLTISNYNQFTESLNTEVLPQTLVDAIATARTLSVPFLWIDALCIIQDSAADKTREIARMKDIYAASALTIVAASARCVTEGFLYPRIHSEPSWLIPTRLQPNVFGTMFINELDAACYDERLEPLAKRAWSMQEILLAQRTVTFTSRTMMWRCEAVMANFGDSLYFPHNLDSGFNDDDETYSLNLHTLLVDKARESPSKNVALSRWLRLVTAYSLRSMTLERDKLNAIAGAASHTSFVQALGPGYFAGLWQYDFARQLMWTTSSSHGASFEDTDTDLRLYRPTVYRAPSWSWASVEGGGVHFDFWLSNEEQYKSRVLCEVEDCQTTPRFATSNRFGEIISAQLRIRGIARYAWFKPSTSNIFVLPKLPLKNAALTFPSAKDVVTLEEAEAKHCDDFQKQHPEVDLAEDQEATYGTDFRNMHGAYDVTGAQDPIIVMCFALTEDDVSDVKGIILLPSEIEGSFRRIGWFDGAKLETFSADVETIISIV